MRRQLLSLLGLLCGSALVAAAWPAYGRNIAAGLVALIGGLAAVIVDSAPIAREPSPQNARTTFYPSPLL